MTTETGKKFGLSWRERVRIIALECTVEALKTPGVGLFRHTDTPDIVFKKITGFAEKIEGWIADSEVSAGFVATPRSAGATGSRVGSGNAGTDSRFGGGGDGGGGNGGSGEFGARGHGIAAGRVFTTPAGVDQVVIMHEQPGFQPEREASKSAVDKLLATAEEAKLDRAKALQSSIWQGDYGRGGPVAPDSGPHVAMAGAPGEPLTPVTGQAKALAGLSDFDRARARADAAEKAEAEGMVREGYAAAALNNFCKGPDKLGKVMEAAGLPEDHVRFEWLRRWLDGRAPNVEDASRQGLIAAYYTVIRHNEGMPAFARLGGFKPSPDHLAMDEDGYIHRWKPDEFWPNDKGEWVLIDELPGYRVENGCLRWAPGVWPPMGSDI